MSGASEIDNADAPVEPDVAEVSEIVVTAFETLPPDFRERWELFDEIPAWELAERIKAHFENQPRERRNILIAYLARKLGYRWLFGSTTKLHVEPLWDLLRADRFALLDEDDRRILWMIACTSRRVQQTLHPKAALAAIALWRHGDGIEREKAELLLAKNGLPHRTHFIYDLVRALGRRGAEQEVDDHHGLYALAMLHLGAGLWDVAAIIAGLFLVRRFAPWYTGSPKSNLEEACDRAATEHPFEFSHWFLLMADAAIGGQLTSSWLERPIEATIRLSADDIDRNNRIRAHHDRRLYEADRDRLKRLYAYQLEQLGPNNVKTQIRFPGAQSVLDRFAVEVERTARENPFRAMRLLELVVSRTYGLPLPQVLHNVEALEPLTERLLTLYVRVCHLDPVAVRFVRDHAGKVDWPAHYDVTHEDVTAYQLVGDYEATFGARSADLLGVSIAHLDKDAAARVRYFQTSRTDPNSIAKLLRSFELPSRLLVTQMGASDVLANVTDDLFDFFEKRAAARDLRPEVLTELRRVGLPIRDWNDIGMLPITKIETALERGRERDLLFGAASGGIAGMLSPLTTGVSSVIDVPVILGLVADTCARHCWYYGFDPREHRELPVMILAVALGGVEAQRESPARVRRRLQAYLVRRSILLAALGQGALAQIAGPTAGMLLGHIGGTQNSPLLVGALNRIARRDQKSNRGFTRLMRRFMMPAADGLIGAAFNVSLVYDLGESAHAVLADRFLARKYDEWERRF